MKFGNLQLKQVIMKPSKTLKCEEKVKTVRISRAVRKTVRDKKFTFDAALINLGVHKVA